MPAAAWRSYHGPRGRIYGGAPFLDANTVDALLDTGARSLLVSLGAADRIGVAQAVPDTEPGGITSGVDMRARTHHWHRFDSLRIGGETITNPVLTVAPIG